MALSLESFTGELRINKDGEDVAILTFSGSLVLLGGGVVEFPDPGGLAPFSTAAPAVTGIPQVGETLTTTTGTWDNNPTSYTYQWQRDGSNIASATATTYVLQAADSGTQVRCSVTATNGFGSTVAQSNAVSVSGAGADVTTVFGALTAAGAGGVPVTGASISSGDASGHWQISGGLISPSAAGDTANLNLGPYSLVLNNAQTVAITVLANGYSVATQAELTAAISAAASQTTTDNIIEGRSGLVIGSYGTDYTPAATNKSGTLTDANSGSYTANNNGYNRTNVATLSGGSTTIRAETGGTITFRGRVRPTSKGPWRFSTGCLFENFGGGSQPIYTALYFDSTAVVAIIEGTTFTPATPEPAGNGNVFDGIRLFKADTVIIQDNRFNQYQSCVKISAGNRISVRRNTFRPGGDCITIRNTVAANMTGTLIRLEVNDNNAYEGSTHASYNSFHADFLQFGQPSDQVDISFYAGWNYFYAEPDVAGGGNRRSQFFFNDDSPASVTTVGEASNNFAAITSLNGLTAWNTPAGAVGDPKNGLVFQCNTLVRNAEGEGNPLQQSPPKITISSGGTVASWYNVVVGYSGGTPDDEIGNVLGLDEDVAPGSVGSYSDAFDGPFTLGTWGYKPTAKDYSSPANFRTWIEATWTPKAGGVAVGAGFTRARTVL